MRRFFFACALVLLFSATICYKQMVGFVLKTVVKSQIHSLLAYKDLQFDEGNLILKDLVLLDSSYLLHSEKMTLTIDWKWPFSFFIHVEKPHLLVSPEYFTSNALNPSKSRFKWSLQLEEGRLEWADQSLPSSQFSLLVTSDELFEVGISWEQGVLEVKKSGNLAHAEWSQLPFRFFLVAAEWSGFSLPVSGPLGTLKGEADLNLEEKTISWTTMGDPLSFVGYKTHLGGGFFCDGTWKDNALEKIRLFVKEGALQSPTSEINHIESNLTYQKGLGVKFVGKGIAARESLELGVEWEGKSFFQQDALQWAEGRIRFGKAAGSLHWDGKWVIDWKDVAKDEIAILQGFAANLVPSIADWNWRAGTIDGKGAIQKGHPELVAIACNDVSLETPHVSFETKKASYKGGDWEIDEFNIRRDVVSLQGNGKWHSEIQGQKAAFVGEVLGVRFAGTGQIDGETFFLSIPRFEGNLPPCLWPELEGKIEALGDGFEVRGTWNGLEDWLFSCKVTEGRLPFIPSFECTLIANPDSVDVISAKGQLSASIGDYPFNASFFAPRIQWKGAAATFDLRLQDGPIDLLRLKGAKEANNYYLDSSHSYFFGKPIALNNAVWEKNSSLIDLETEIDSSLFSYLGISPQLPKVQKVHFTGQLTDQKMGFSLETDRGTVSAEKKGNQWNSHFSFGSTKGHSSLEYKDGSLRATAGHVLGPGLSFDFEGVVNRKLEGAVILKQISADLKHIGLEGNIEGGAQISFTKEEFQTDLDFLLKDALWEGFSFENGGPLHLYYSSLQGMRIKGIDCRIHKENLEAHAKIELLQFEKKRWSVQKAKTHIPTDFFHSPLLDRGAYLDCLADLSFSSDLMEGACAVKEAHIPLGGSLRHIKDFHLLYREDSLFSEAFVYHKAKWAKISLDMILTSSLRGRCYIAEPEKKEPPLSIDWTYEKSKGLSILSIEGAFAGLDASFHAFERGKLIGSSRVDFRRAAEWLPNEVARGFDELKLGKGYELKGNLQIDPQVSFQGICSGKQIELAGFQFRTLLAKVDLNPTLYRIYDVKVSDSAGILKIDDIQMKQENGQPWTIEIPQFTIEELRPSLLIKPGEMPGPVSPLVVRQFNMVDFHGLLDDGNTWVANGELSFINSFKREETVFDLPANVLGRIVGLDLDLLIPVKGELTFDLKDGYFNLNELTGAYSEGRRSEFFLVQTESNWPRVDLDGNLEILVTMKQFVLFSLTEAFLISIDGKLNDPHFSLQKKKRFL